MTKFPVESNCGDVILTPANADSSVLGASPIVGGKPIATTSNCSIVESRGCGIDEVRSQNSSSSGMGMNNYVSSSSSNNNNAQQPFHSWSPTGVWYRDLFHFVGPGWFVCIAYVDPGNYQADIQAGATTKYYLLFALWWTSILSIYVQILCVRLAYYGQVTLAEVQARDNNEFMRRLNWFIAELSAVITDLPEVIGIGIACNIFFGWPYYAGVSLSLFTTMLFLAVLKCGIKVLEVIIFIFVGIMSIALWVEMGFVGVNGSELMAGWVYGFTKVTSNDIFAITGISGSVVMPHNLYLHTAACQSRRVLRHEEVVRKAVKWSSLEPILPILASFFVNMAIVSISAERIYGTSDQAGQVGLTDFCNYFQVLKGGCILWATALLAAGQSSAITTTFTGQYVMDGFLSVRLPVRTRAILTRLVAIIPCVIASVMFSNDLSAMVNVVNAALSFLLPFAFTPLVKYNCSERYMGKFASRGLERILLYIFALLVHAVNAIALSAPGGGFFGFVWTDVDMTTGKRTFYFVLQFIVQLFYAWWNWYCILSPVTAPMTPLEQERPYDCQFAPLN